MAHENVVMDFMETVWVADKHLVGDYMSHKGYWKAGVSAVNNSYKALLILSELHKLLNCNGYFKVPWCRSEYKEHARLLTKTLSEILKRYEAVIHREKTINEVALRPDALVLLKKEGKGRCLIVEVCISEEEKYLSQKINTLEHWERSTQFLSELFGYRIPHYEFLVVGAAHPKAITLEEV